jgi:hypothetical protein
MLLDPADQRWIDARRNATDARIAELTGAANNATGKLVALNMRLRVIEDRNKTLWGLLVSLGLVLLGVVGNAIYRGGTIDATQAAHAKQIDALDARIRELERAEKAPRGGRPGWVAVVRSRPTVPPGLVRRA